MADTPDPVAAYLVEVRELIGKRDELVARMQVAAVDVREFNAAQDRLAEHGPRLLAAVEAVLKLADDWGTDRPGDSPVTGACGRRLREEISRALLGEGADDG
jgi:hypothetical protein